MDFTTNKVVVRDWNMQRRMHRNPIIHPLKANFLLGGDTTTKRENQYRTEKIKRKS
jgi:hypothetical protein